MSEYILDKQEAKNQEAAIQEPETLREKFTRLSNEAADKMEQALNGGKDTFMAYINGQAKEMGIDPNDHVETSERTDPAEVLEVEHRECYGLN